MDQSLNKQILTALSVEGADLRSYSALALAFMGDSIYELIVRTGVVGKGNVSPQKLNAMTSHLSKAPAQAAIAKAFMDQLTDEEADVFRRGKNSVSTDENGKINQEAIKMLIGDSYDK